MTSKSNRKLCVEFAVGGQKCNADYFRSTKHWWRNPRCFDYSQREWSKIATQTNFGLQVYIENPRVTWYLKQSYIRNKTYHSNKRRRQLSCVDNGKESACLVESFKFSTIEYRKMALLCA